MSMGNDPVARSLTEMTELVEMINQDCRRFCVTTALQLKAPLAEASRQEPVKSLLDGLDGTECNVLKTLDSIFAENLQDLLTPTLHELRRILGLFTGITKLIEAIDPRYREFWLTAAFHSQASLKAAHLARPFETFCDLVGHDGCNVHGALATTFSEEQPVLLDEFHDGLRECSELRQVSHSLAEAYWRGGRDVMPMRLYDAATDISSIVERARTDSWVCNWLAAVQRAVETIGTKGSPFWADDSSGMIPMFDELTTRLGLPASRALLTAFETYKKREYRKATSKRAREISGDEALAAADARGARDWSPTWNRAEIAEALKALPQEQECKAIFTLRFEQGLSINEIAQRLGIAKKVVDQAVRVILQHLNKWLEPE